MLLNSNNTILQKALYSLPWRSRSSSCRARCSGRSHPAGPSLPWPPGRFPGGGMWRRRRPVWGTAGRPQGARPVARGTPGCFPHRCPFHRHQSWTSSGGPAGDWDPRGSRPISSCRSARRIGRGPRRRAPPRGQRGDAVGIKNWRLVWKETPSLFSFLPFWRWLILS